MVQSDWQRRLQAIRDRGQQAKQKGLQSWLRFQKLSTAMDWKRDHGLATAHVLSEETGSNGRRCYLLVQCLRDFWEYYCRLDPLERHFYEVLEDGQPCHLYFDVEFYHAFQPAPVCGAAILADFKRVSSV